MNNKEVNTFTEIVQQYEYQILELHLQLKSKQAEIDRLMLEFCPDEMTEEQLDNWKHHQKIYNSFQIILDKYQNNSKIFPRISKDFLEFSG